MKLKSHPVADLYPLNDADVERLVESICDHGQLEPIRLTADGLILDGRNRYQACQKIGVEPKTETLPEMTEEELTNLARAYNGDRRDLTKSQRAAVAAGANDYLRKTIGHQKPGPKGKIVPQNGTISEKAWDRLSAQYKVGKSMIGMALEILDDDEPDSAKLFKLILEGDETLSAIYPDWKKAKDERARAIKKIKDPRMSQLRAKAPDLADQVEAGTMTYDDALKESTRREAEKEARAKFLTEKYSSLTMIVTMARTMKKELTPEEWREAVGIRPEFIRERDLKDIQETFETLSSLRELITSVTPNV